MGTEPDPAGITITVNTWTVSASEKISTGDYENYNPHLTVAGSFEPDGDTSLCELTPTTEALLEAELLRLQRHLQCVLERACENKIALPENEDWSPLTSSSVDPAVTERES